MEETLTKQQLLDIKTDMKLLLECMNYQKDDPSALKQALVTLSCSLQSCSEAKDIFRDTGGLQSVLDTVTTTKYGEVTEAGLYCLGSAVEKNVYSQKLLSTASTFTFLHNILSDDGSSVRKKRTAAFLILCLVSNNGFGQNLARESTCLHDITSLIRISLPGTTQHSSADWLNREDGKSVALWCALVSTACVCVNNPLNEENQRICASLLPFLFSLLQQETSHKICRPILSLIGLTVANNGQNQDRVRKCGGLDMFVKLLKKLVSKMDTDVESKTTAVQLLNTLDSCIADNEENARLIGKLGAISLIIKMLSERSLEDQDKTQIVLTLANSTDMYEGNKKYIKDCGGITSLIQQLTLTESEELTKTVKYLLQLCVSSDAENVVTLDENNNLATSEPLVANMERMKRQNDLQMLERINELDNKLKSMQNEVHLRQESNTQLELGSRSFSFNSPGNQLQKSRSEKSLSLSRMEMCSEMQAPMTPRETSLLSQLEKERKEKERLEILNQMLQENMHVCLTHVAAKENCSKQESCYSKSGAQIRSGAQIGSSNEVDLGSLANTGSSVQIGSGVQLGSSVQRRLGTQTRSSTQLGSRGVQIESVDPTGSGVQTSFDAQKGSGLQIKSVAHEENSGHIETEGFASFRPRNKLATPSGDACANGIQNRQTERTVSKHRLNVPIDFSVKRNIFSTDKAILETEKLYSNGSVGYVTHEGASSNVQTQKSGNPDFHNMNLYDQNNNVYSTKSGLIQSHALSSEFSAASLQTCQSYQTSLNVQSQPALGVSCTPGSRSVAANLHPGNVVSNIHDKAKQYIFKKVDPVQYSKNPTSSTSNFDRVLQIENTQPYVGVERFSATPCSQNPTVSLNKQNLGNASEIANNTNVSTEKTPDISKNSDKNANSACVESGTNKTKAKRVLLEYTKAASKSTGTLTTPSLSNIAAKDDEEQKNDEYSNVPKLQRNERGASKVKETLSKTTETQTATENETTQRLLSDTSVKSRSEVPKNNSCDKDNDMNKPTANTPTKTDKKQHDSANIGNGKSIKGHDLCVSSRAESSKLYSPLKDNPQATAVSKDISEPFVKPRAPPPRRKVRVTPQLGSGKLPTFHRKQKEATTTEQDIDNSDVESEFDFKLLKTAKEKRIKHFFDTSKDNNSCTAENVTERKSNNFARESSSKNLNTLNVSSLSLKSRCSDWSAVAVTPTKRQTVLPRPAFSDCGSRRPVFDSPISVKSVGRTLKRMLDDSGICSSGNGLNVSPGASSLSGSSDSASDLSSILNSNPIEESDGHTQSQTKRNKKKTITVYKKQEHCPGCQAPATINGQILNSRTYSIALETDPNTCLFHRKLRQYERLHIHHVKKAQKSTAGRLLDSLQAKIRRREKRKKTKTSVYEFESDITEQVSPLSQSSDEDETQPYPSKHKRRRQRLEYTEDEEHYLLEGLRKMGKCWTQILATYQFHPSRTAVDLKDKYKSMAKSAETKSIRSTFSGRSRILKPFSMCEERRLRRGIKKFGYSWKTILEHFTFSRDRTAEDLRNRWRSMHRRGKPHADINV